ncbi:universal stress protein [Thalassococcus sp. BH17M4-6]|uniref:universal stress protein n=1 Tax=Thalassococcus sp. BH17M4-6 TaxID=3413148 RepID=UPI003BDEA349
MFKKILVAADGSDHAKVAVDTAADLAQQSGAELHVVHVPEVQMTAIAVGASAVEVPVNEEETERAAQEVLTAAKAQADEAGAKVTSSELRHGDPALAILDRAKEVGADLLVMGRRGRGPLQGLLLGSVSQKLSAHADSAVLTVK